MIDPPVEFVKLGDVHHVSKRELESATAKQGIHGLPDEGGVPRRARPAASAGRTGKKSRHVRLFLSRTELRPVASVERQPAARLLRRPQTEGNTQAPGEQRDRDRPARRPAAQPPLNTLKCNAPLRPVRPEIN